MLTIITIYAAFASGTAAGIIMMCLLQVGREHN
jgi:hypothetical protein